METEKKCKICNMVKDISNFSMKNIKKNLHHQECKPCRSAEIKYQYNNDEKFKEKRRFLNWKSKIKKKYKLTPDCYYKMLAEQNGVCCICKSDDPKTKNSSDKFCIDHNHETGEVRGLLCSDCNSALGQLKDKPEVVMSAYEYLIRNGHDTRYMKIGKKRK